MGKAGRFACILTPMLLTLASLICILLVGLGGTNQSNNTLNNFYFLKTDTRNFKANATLNLIPDTNLDNNILGDVLQNGEDNINLKDFYTVSLWNYCNGTVEADNSSHVDACGKPVGSFYFNFVDVWGLNNSIAGENFPKELQSGLNTYAAVSKWMYIAYVIAFVATVVELVVGFFAIFSRWGSLATTLASSVSSVFVLAASATATGLFATLMGTINSVFKDLGIVPSLGKSMFITTWLAVAFSWAAGLFWLFSVCCCAAHSRNPRQGGVRNRDSMEKPLQPYGYERVGSPYMGHGSSFAAPTTSASGAPQLGVPLQQMPYGQQYQQQQATGYEPFRHTNV
ncbi:MAG: hypothetical protein M1838_000311 [Thelocarpon superellum]|nr:MAG: hypothetical protein M1838_000311 [Thelocarpon superellum]